MARCKRFLRIGELPHSRAERNPIGSHDLKFIGREELMTGIANITFRLRFALTLALAVSAVALVPAAASAKKTYFGSSLNHSPANAGSTCAENGVMGPLLCTHVGSFYPGFSGRAKATHTGTIFQIRLRAQGPTTLRIRVVAVRKLSSDHKSGQAKTIVKGPKLNPVGTGDIETFPVNLKVKKGQELAVDTTSNTAEYCSDGTPGQLLFDPVLGKSFRNSDGVDGCLMLVQARVKY